MVQIGRSSGPDFSDPFTAFGAVQRELESRLGLLRKHGDAVEDGVLNDDTREGLSQALSYLEANLGYLAADDNESFFPRVLEALKKGNERPGVPELTCRLAGDHIAGQRLLSAVSAAVKAILASEDAPEANQRIILAARIVALSRHYKAYLAAKDRDLLPVARELLADDEATVSALAEELRERRGIDAAAETTEVAESEATEAPAEDAAPAETAAPVEEAAPAKEAPAEAPAAEDASTDAPAEEKKED